jgi:hypothetical protein
VTAPQNFQKRADRHRSTQAASSGREGTTESREQRLWRGSTHTRTTAARAWPSPAPTTASSPPTPASPSVTASCPATTLKSLSCMSLNLSLAVRPMYISSVVPEFRVHPEFQTGVGFSSSGSRPRSPISGSISVVGPRVCLLFVPPMQLFRYGWKSVILFPVFSLLRICNTLT